MSEIARFEIGCDDMKSIERFTGAGLRWSAPSPPGITLVACTLETGRQHQIRIHLGEQGTPLVGEKVYDRDYDGPRLVGFADGDGRPMLHAAELGFTPQSWLTASTMPAAPS